MAQDWTLEEIVQEVREVSGRPSSNQISDSELNDRVNDFYTQRFAQDIGVSNIEGTHTIDVTATDDGDYELPDSVLRLSQPVTINGVPSNEFTFYQEEGPFFIRYPELEDYVTNPNLRIGTSDPAKVKYDDFSYSIDRYSYSANSNEIALNGDTVPRDTYAAWSFKIDVDGNVTVTPASGNGSGYASQRLALEGIGGSNADIAYMGYVTVIRSDFAFVPGDSSLDKSGVIVAFTDGDWDNRDVPEAILIWQNKVFIRPKANDIYRLTAGSLERPSELTSGVSPVDKAWGRAIAYGTAIELMDEKAEGVSTQLRMYKKLVGFINRKKQNQDGKDRLASRSF
jgi:hypothetical protein